MVTREQLSENRVFDRTRPEYKESAKIALSEGLITDFSDSLGGGMTRFFRRCDKFSSGNESNINNKIIRIMAKYKVKARYIFEGPYTVVAEDHDEAERMVTEDCGLVLGGNIHTTRDDDEVADWNFGCHPDLQILSIRQKGGKSPKLVFGDRIEELREEIIDAIRQLLHAHAMKTIRFQEKDCDSVWVVWFNKNGDPYECRVTGLRVTA